MASGDVSERERWSIVRAYAADHADVFAGAYVGARGQPSIVTLWTDDPAKHAAVLSDRTGRVVGGVEARWTLADLEGVAAQVRDDMEVLVERGIAVCSVGVDVIGNRVEIGVTGLTDEIHRTLTTKYGAAVAAVEDEVTPV